MGFIQNFRQSVLCLAICILQTLAGTLKTDTVIQCDDGWVQRSDSCYLWTQALMSDFNTARQDCYIHDSDLLIISNKDEQSWVNSQSLQYKTDGWWIGSQKNTKTLQWSWVFGSGVRLNWAAEPDNFQNQDCVATNLYEQYFDENCNNKLGYICKFTKPDRAQCPGNPPKAVRWYQNGNVCYYVSDPLDPTQHLTWFDAKKRCASLSQYNNGELLSLGNLQELVFIFQTLPKNTANTLALWWTGLNDQKKEGTYVWQNGTAPTLQIPWDQSPNNRSGEDENCAIMYSGGVVDDGKCTSMAYYICEKTAIQQQYDLGCGGKWTRAGHSCYLFGKANGYTWTNARNKCLSASADLIKIDSKDEANWINKLDLGGGGFWTGLRTHNVSVGTRPWYWTDGTSVDTSLVRWNEEPNNYAENEDCAVMGHDGVYNDMKCDAMEGYICMYKNNNGGDCIPGFFSKGYSQYCFYISSTNESDLLTWYSVSAQCSNLVQSDGTLVGQMLKLTGNFDKELIVEELQKRPETPYGWWTGLNDIQYEGVWTYPDNTLPDSSLVIWNQEPNNKGGNENCATMYSGGRYNDLNCEAKQHFICERPAAGFAPSSSSRQTIDKRTIILLCSIIVFATQFLKNE